MSPATTQPRERERAPNQPRRSPYVAQREHMEAVARRHFPDADKIKAFAAPETPYVEVWANKRARVIPWWEIEE